MARGLVFYRSERGKKRKKELNQDRAIRDRDRDLTRTKEAGGEETAVEESGWSWPLPRSELRLHGFRVVAGVLAYLPGVLSLIEGRKVGDDEISAMFHRISRQRSISRRRRIEYIVSRLNNEPP